MDTINQIFKKKSIDFFDYSCRAWLLDDSIYYIGSYIFDINGQLYNDGERHEYWLGDGDDDKAKNIANTENYKRIREVFDLDSPYNNDNNEANSITEFIQRKYLTIQEDILHLFIDKSGNNIFEILIRDGEIIDDDVSYQKKQYNDIAPLLSELGNKKADIIKDVFDFHFDLIRKAQDSHIYFFPIFLELSDTRLVYNVTTTIGPNSLEDDDVCGVQFGAVSSTSKLMSDTVEYLHKLAHDEATKSAKAAIMSRNMSHNIGSHVMSYLKQHLSSVKDIVANGILADLINGESELGKKLNNTTENTTLPFLMGLGHFISYLQERQDFIATIATDYIPYFGNVNFKDAIYDYLNPDKRAERHTERKNGKTDNILLGNIARSEGLGRTTQTTSNSAGQLSDIILNFRDSSGYIFDGAPVVTVEDNNTVIIPGRENARKALDAMRELEVSLPGGVIGRQAVFSIVENIIRNAAKHGNWRDQGRLELTFDFINDEAIEEFSCLKQREADLKGKTGKLTEEELSEYDTIKEELKKWNKDAAPIEAKESYPLKEKDHHYSLMEVLRLFYSKSLDANDLYIITITDNIPISESAIYKLRNALDEGYIDKDSRMIEGNKGIKEIRISAAWLRGAKNEEEYYNQIPKNEEPQSEKKAPLVYVRQHNGCLQYIICVFRPKKVAIVSSRFSVNENINDDAQEIEHLYNKKVFLEKSCGAFSPKQYLDERNKSYEFIIYDDISEKDDNEDLGYDALRRISSSRFWKLSDIHELSKQDNQGEIELFKRIKELSQSDYDIIITSLYKKLAKYKNGDCIIVDDKTATGNVARDTKEGKYTLSGNVAVQDGITNKGVYKFIYRTHHDTTEQYENFIKAVGDKTILDNFFVEGITGNNSTDRLIRNESLDDVWFYKHLHAIKEQVAIFDERLFTKIYGLEESHLKEQKVLEINNSNRPLYRKRYKKEVLKGNEDKWSELLGKELSEQDTIFKNAFKDDCGPVMSKEIVDAQTGILPVTYKQKGVYIFTLVQEPNPQLQNTFNLYGQLISDSLTESKCLKVATLSWNSEKGLIINGLIKNKNNKYKRFDLFSIHQGILDKLYEVFGIKDKPYEKELLTKEFFNTFSSSVADVEEKEGYENKEEMIEEKDNLSTEKNKHYFLPGMSIHSGRSKPGSSDMPQQIPFIQYASIENAVLDCKYSLVELLDFARYE